MQKNAFIYIDQNLHRHDQISGWAASLKSEADVLSG